MKIGLASDHGGFMLKSELASLLAHDHEVTDFGATHLDAADDYPDFVIPLAKSVASGALARGICVCGSGVGASVCANKVAGVRAALITDPFSARQGVEDDDVNVICLGGRVIGPALAWELVQGFLAARYSRAERHERRLAKVKALEVASR